jgi:hypothetical protein
MSLRLKSEDLDLLDVVLGLAPELRCTVLIGQEARKRGLSYPVESVNQLVDLLDGTALTVDNYQLDARTLRKFVPPERFPIQHEVELMALIHMALVRCRVEAATLMLEKLDLEKLDLGKLDLRGNRLRIKTNKNANQR